MPDAGGKFKGISLDRARFWPGHRDYVPTPDLDRQSKEVFDELVRRAFGRAHWDPSA